MPSDPANYDNNAVSGPDSDLSKASMSDEGQSLCGYDMFDWVDPHHGVPLIPSKLIRNKWHYKQLNGVLVSIRPKGLVVVEGIHEADTGKDHAPSVASMESAHLLVSNE